MGALAGTAVVSPRDDCHTPSTNHYAASRRRQPANVAESAVRGRGEPKSAARGSVITMDAAAAREYAPAGIENVLVLSLLYPVVLAAARARAPHLSSAQRAGVKSLFAAYNAIMSLFSAGGAPSPPPARRGAACARRACSRAHVVCRGVFVQPARPSPRTTR